MNVLKNSKFDNQIVDFFPYGSDERQFCSPGINLPVGSLYRSDNKYLEFPEYHSSADNFSIISEKALAETFEMYFEIIMQLNKNKKNQKNQKNQNKDNIIKRKEKGIVYLNQFPKCEPQLGKRGLYRKIGGTSADSDKEIFNQLSYLWILNFSDGNHSLEDISELSNIELKVIKKSAEILEKKNLLKKI